MNQDGRTQTITTPSPAAQQQLILSCYERAGLDPRETTYVEAHGTGTIAGDKIELGALGATIGRGRGPNDPFYVGSVKANFGHTESTSGLAAVVSLGSEFHISVRGHDTNIELL
jgi:acyl transferase domain-containing protein